jgi:hypothetical protein
MERMGASNGTDGSGLWKGWVHLMKKMGASNGNLWVPLVESRWYFTCKTQKSSKLPLVAYVLYVMLMFMFVNIKDGF